MAWRRSEREQADLFLADLLGSSTPAPGEPDEADPEFFLPTPRWRGEGREPFFGDTSDERWKVVGRPGARGGDDIRDDDIVVYRTRTLSGLAWCCYLVADLNRDSLFRSGTDRLRSNLVIVRRVIVRAERVQLQALPPAVADVDVSTEDQPAPSPTSSLCAADVAVTDAMALLIASKAPLPVTQKEIGRVAADQNIRDDYHAVAAIVPAVPEPRLLIFFHGNGNYVTLAPRGDVPSTVDPSGHSRVPRWVDEKSRKHIVGDPKVKGMDGVKAAPIKYRLDSLPASERALSPEETFKSLAIKDPIVLVPEDAEPKGGKWAVPPPNQYGTSSDGKPQGPGTTRLQELVMECYEHLRCLQTPSGRPYLSRDMSQRASWAGNIRRMYISGHSGGGKPLVEAAGADMALVTPTSAAGVGGRAVELWLYDSTYGFGIKNYVNFCVNWNNAKLLAYRADGARFVCIYRPRDEYGDTESEADQLRSEIAKVLKVPAASLLKLHDSSNMSSPSMIGKVIPALTSSPVIFIRTQVAHDQIPTLFTPLLLRTAAS